MNCSGEEEFDVVIVGYGPVGATLAHLLGLQGVRTLVLEREAATYHLPRAVHFDDEVMRVFQTIGVADRISALTRINPGMRFVDPEGLLLLDWPRPQEVGPQGWHASYRVHQPDLEEVLRDVLAARDSVEVRTPLRRLPGRGPGRSCPPALRGSRAADALSASAPDTSSAVTERARSFAASSRPRWRTTASTSAGWSWMSS